MPTQGIFRIIIEKALDVDLVELLKLAQQNMTAELPNENIIEQAYQFIIERLKYWYIDQGITSEIFEAVIASGTRRPLDFNRRIQAVCRFNNLPEAEALASANKRVGNILKKVTEALPTETDTNLFSEQAEKALAKALKQHSETVERFYQQNDYANALSSLASLKQPVDQFFDEVMVMDEDQAKRKNRLALLKQLRNLFTCVADISLL